MSLNTVSRTLAVAAVGAVSAVAAVAAFGALALSLSAQAKPQTKPQTKPPTNVGAAVPPPAAAPLNEPPIASYVSSKLNNKPLPVIDKASDDAGVQYLIEFDELIMSIQKNHQFRAALRYRQTLASKGSTLGRDPIKKMTVYGSWESVAGRIRFVPDPKRGGEGLRILDGTFAAGRIEVPFDYRNGSVRRRAEVLLLRDDKIF